MSPGNDDLNAYVNLLNSKGQCKWFFAILSISTLWIKCRNPNWDEILSLVPWLNSDYSTGSIAWPYMHSIADQHSETSGL